MFVIVLDAADILKQTRYPPSLPKDEGVKTENMMVTIRLARHGKKRKPFYHIVATDSRNARDGRFLEKLGHYDPNHKPSKYEIKADRVQHWYSLGAQLSPQVAKLVKIDKIALKRVGKVEA